VLTLGTACYRRYDLLAEMIASAEAGERPPDRYFLVDNGGRADARSLPAHTSIFRPGKNIGVAPAVNIVFRQNGDLTIWTNDDVRFERETLALLEQAALTDPERLFVLPESNVGSAFTVFLARKKLFDRIGWFDERFVPAYYEDNDFGYRMHLAEISRHTVPSRYFHHMSATLKQYSPEERRAHDAAFERNRSLYARKWGGLPGHETRSVPAI